MNLDQITSSIAKKTGLTKAQAKTAYEALVETIVEEMNVDPKAEKVEVSLPKIGKFNVQFKDEYEGFNPTKKEKMMIPASRRIYFSAFKALKNRVNEVL